MYINKIHIQNYRNFSDFTMEFLRDIMESDFGIGGGSKGKISSQVEGLGILHGIDKNEIYEHLIPEIQASIKTTTAYEFIQ